MKSNNTGFTIIELIIVIVVIGILATITTLSYAGITQNARVAILETDLNAATKQLRLYQVDNLAFPSTLDCSTSPATNSICLKNSNGTTYGTYVSSNTGTQTFCLTAINNGTTYHVTNDLLPTSGSCSGVLPDGSSCPPSFIVVPGSTTYSTSDFCIAKYEMRQASATVPISQATGTPWTSVSQTNAIIYSANVASCSGCHLATEAEWLTVAQNVIGVASNWSGGSVGSGYIFSGHNDNSPTNSLSASTNDSDGYISTGNSSGNQRRTLTLSNGEVIWDLAGNVIEWTSGTIPGLQQPGLSGEATYAYKQYNNGSLIWNGLPTYAKPSSIYSGAGGWSSAQGIGQLYSYYSEPATRVYGRGGNWSNGANAGVLALFLSGSSSGTYVSIGFRVAK